MSTRSGNGQPGSGPASGRAGEVVSIETVARKAGVSIATVSRIANGITNKASRETVLRVREAIRDLNYRPMRAGSALRTKQTRIVALLIPDATNTFYGAIASSIEKSLREDDHVMILCNTSENPDLQDAYLEEMRAHRVRGIALLGAVDSPVLARFVEEGEPIVFVNRESPAGSAGPFVRIDNFPAGREVAGHFLERRYHPCAVIHGPLQSSASAARFEGYRTRLAEAGRPLAAAHVRAGDLTMTGGYGAAVTLLERAPRPRAIFCGNDLMAYGAFRRCRELDLRVPDDVALFGFDDNPYNEWVAPWLSTVRVPHQAFGPAVRQLFDALWAGDPAGGARKHILPHEVVLRASA